MSSTLVNPTMATVESSEPTNARKVLLDRAKESASLKIGDVEMRFEPEDLDEEYRIRAREELGETDQVVAEALAEIRQLIKGEPNLKVPEDDEEFLKKFLRPCKWHATPAFNLMKRFYQFRLNRERVCKDLVPSKMRTSLCAGVVTPLPRRCKDGTRLLLIEGGKKWKPKELTLEQIFRNVMLSLEAASVEPKTQVAGARVILDMDGLTLTHVTYYTPSYANMVLEWVQKCLAIRLKGIHIINQPYIFNMVFAMFKPFIQEKLRKRIHFHGTDRKALLSHIDACSMPKRYGGELDFPNEPIGEPLWHYFCNFEEEFQLASSYGYVNKT